FEGLSSGSLRPGKPPTLFAPTFWSAWRLVPTAGLDHNCSVQQCFSVQQHHSVRQRKSFALPFARLLKTCYFARSHLSQSSLHLRCHLLETTDLFLSQPHVEIDEQAA